MTADHPFLNDLDRKLWTAADATASDYNKDADVSREFFATVLNKLEWAINWLRWNKWIAGFSNGTTMNMLPKDALEKPLLVVPPAELANEFTTLAKSTAQRF